MCADVASPVAREGRARSQQQRAWWRAGSQEGADGKAGTIVSQAFEHKPCEIRAPRCDISWVCTGGFGITRDQTLSAPVGRSSNQDLTRVS